jgi:thiamine monophosphate synthase
MPDWGPKRQCEAIVPDGQQCALASGHDANHLNAYDVTQQGITKGFKVQIIIGLVALVVLFATFGRGLIA